MTQPYVDTVREAKTQNLKNINKRTKKHIPAYVFQAHANLIDKFPDAGHFLTPSFVYNTLREITKAAEAQLCADETSSVDLFGWGKFTLTRKENCRYAKGITQMYIKFTVSNILMCKIRRHFGTATESQLKTLENSENYMGGLQAKRLKFLSERELKRKGQLAEEDPENYIGRFYDTLQLNQD